MQEVKYRVVRKRLEELKKGDVLHGFNEIVGLDIEHIDQKIKLSSGVWPTTKGFRDTDTINPDGTYNVIELIEDVAESATTKAVPAPETATIEIKGERFTVTRKPCGGWSEPVLFVPTVGDEVRLSDLNEGDQVLIDCRVFKGLNEHGYVGIVFDKEDQLFLDGDQKVIYNGRVE